MSFCMRLLRRFYDRLGVDTLRAGVVGTGSVAETAHLPVYSSDPRTKLVAVADLNVDSLSAAASKYGIEQTYEDGIEMIEEADLDLVSISTPPATHKGLFIAAADAGVHVYCEKPMAISVEDAEAMADSAESAGIITQVGYTRPYIDSFKTVSSLIDNNILGEIRSLHTHRIRSPPSGGWNYDPSVSGGGVVSDQLPHILDFYIRIFETTPEVHKVRMESKDVPVVEDYAEIDFEFDGTPVRTTLGWTLHTQHQRNVLVADYGTIEYDMSDITGEIQSTELAQRNGSNPIIDVEGVFRAFTADEDDFHHERVRDFVDHVATGDRDTIASVKRGVQVTRGLRAVYDTAGWNI